MPQKKTRYHLGLDVGSTTVKAVLIDSAHKILFSEYERHHTDARATFIALVKRAMQNFKGGEITVAVTGSGGIDVARLMDIQFLQEVIACSESITTFLPKTDVAIELGGEDAKLTFFQGTIDQRMNETCAGGTGAFIDQMAVSLQTDAAGVNALAAKHKMIYPIAARCGVFAKTDVTVLLNEGASRADVAASIFQAVVDQTIGGLACGNKIRGNVAFLGGPLHFLSELKNRFIETLQLQPEQVFAPDNAHFFVALGCALLSKTQPSLTKDALLEKIEHLANNGSALSKVPQVPALFETEKDYKAFKERHDKVKVPYKELKAGVKDVYLGIDAGSTTTKAVLLDKDNAILRSWYGPNKGNPLMSVKEVLEELYSELPKSAALRRACITGYGEAMLRTAFGIDDGEVETLVHCKAAAHFVKDVSFILDIGGQDMKCIYLKKGRVDKIILNEACSSGCGSFIETFASSLHLNIQDFAKEALKSKAPIDLGSRCTVFMNSKVKQAQKEGAAVADISAGLSYSVAKNALYKVIKIGSPEELGKQIVVQGGTFFNDAVLRAFETLIGRPVFRPQIAGLMGAFGAALLAKENAAPKTKSTLISAEDLKTFTVKSDNRRCSGCANRCLLTINRFPSSKVFISGNKCEKGGGKEAQTNKKTDLFQLKYKRLFDHYKPLPADKAIRGDIGIPRALNIYDDYPMWFTIFTDLGYRVILSDPSSKGLFNKGLETIPSQTACYPAKMVHGHIANLIDKGVKRIFYPAVPTARKEFKDANNCYNCPVVGSYPELIRLNMDIIKESDTALLCPFLPIDDEKRLAKRLHKEFSKDGLSLKEIQKAVKKGFAEYFNFQKDIRKMGEELLADLVKTGEKGIVLAGRPYHLDPAINHGIPGIISGSGVSVFTEDSISHLGKDLLFPLSVVDQWTYHARLYRAATVVAKTPNLQMVQLNSFGCGLDAVTGEQVEKILGAVGKPHTLIKIDEGTFLGAVKIRIRSLLSMMAKNDPGFGPISIIKPSEPPKLTRDKAKEFTILCPQMAPIHFSLLQESFKPLGYHLEILPSINKQSVEEGLRYVNNDACYPAITVVGQLIQALKSGKYDLNKTAVIISQTGGGCRATNYVSFLKDAVRKAGFTNVPVLAFNMNDMASKDSPFKVTTRMYVNFLYSFLIGDVISRVALRMRPYELVKGTTDARVDKWIKKSKDVFTRKISFKKLVHAIVKDFDRLPIDEKLKKPRVGIVGEILVKFHPGANNHLIDVIEHEGGEAVLPDFMDFALYCLTDKIYRHRYLSGKLWPSLISHVTIWYVERYRNIMRKALRNSKHFTPLETIYSLKRMINDIVSPCNQTGEGWLLTAEMIELIHAGAPNIVCVQPFACLPNHITGKGVMKELKRRYPEANIAAIDYDPGASEVNQLNRIKLMMSVAFKAHKTEDSRQKAP